ncbi:XRE family transcriptional regulator [Butyricicoccus sp.]|uniref:XRE family transcriptional regulator n=1 Tax=Butyricicoccus sp. TaxID=2049021 RepID=UPI003F180604
MLRNLQAEIVRNQISVSEIGRVICKTDRTARDKINGVSAFTFPEAVKIRDVFFPSMRLEYLFAEDSCDLIPREERR